MPLVKIIPVSRACVVVVLLTGRCCFSAGAANDQWTAFDDAKNIWIGVIIGVGAGLLCAATVVPYLRWKIPRELAAKNR